MMKWGRKKSSLSNSSSSISSIFPSSWFSKFRQTKHNSEFKTEKGKGELGSVYTPMHGSWKNGGDDYESYWRLSFGEENFKVDKYREFNFPSCNNFQNDEETWEFNRMVSYIRKSRGSPLNEEPKVPRRKSCKERKPRKGREDSVENMSEFGRRSDNMVPQVKDIYELKPVKLTRSTKKEYLKPAKIEEEILNPEWGKLKEMKIKEIMAKSENKRKSIYISSEPQRRTRSSSKIKAYSPRTSYRVECKIKAIEDLKKAKKKSEKRTKEKLIAERRTAFDSFAVVKSSCDPQRDFKNSMVEMITAKGIRKAEELEELLACYLTLNADIYHDIIIKVFRQVWFELLNQDHLVPGM